MKKTNILLLFLITLIFFLSSCSYSRNKANDYNKYLNEMDNAQTYMPSLDTLGDYENIYVGYKCTSTIFFEPVRTIVLFVEYADSYYQYKEKLLNNYKYLNEPIYISDGRYSMPEVEIEYRSYVIKVIDERPEENLDQYLYIYSFPKYFMMSGYNDENKTLVYLFYEDFDLDLFPYANLHTLIDKYFNFKKIN